MRIRELTARGFKVPDRTYTFQDKAGPCGVVVLEGSPGSGKTVLLRLLCGAKEAFAPYGTPPELRPLLRPGESGRLTLTVTLDAGEMAQAKLQSSEQSIVVDVDPSGAVCSAAPALAALLAPSDRAAAVTRWELFPAHRRLATSEWHIAHPPLSAAIEDGRRLAPDGDKYLALRRVLHDLAVAEATGVARVLGEKGVALLGDGPEGLAPWKAAVATVLPDLRLLAVDLGSKSASPVFLRRSGERVTIAELSASEEQGVLFAFAFTWLGLEAGIVLVDSPELHLGADRQGPFVERLAALGRNAQFFLATGSPAVAALPGALVIDLDGTAGARS